ncbi:5643_t:CDS:2, partial [Gigaspora rosea]
GAQSSDLERNQIETLAKIGELDNQNEAHEFKEALELYEEGYLEEIVDHFLTSKDKLTSDDKVILEDAANELLYKQDNTLIIKTAKKAMKILEMTVNGFSESPKERVLKNTIRNFFENTLVLENKLSLKNKLDLGRQITLEDKQTLKKTKEVLEAAVNNLLTSKRKKVLLLLGSRGTGKSIFNHFIARSIYGKKGKLSTEQIKELRNRKLVFILDGYGDEIAE